jgi:hypothetical protein
VRLAEGCPGCGRLRNVDRLGLVGPGSGNRLGVRAAPLRLDISSAEYGMTVATIVKEALKWIAATFGKDIIVLTKDLVQHQWARFFGSCSVLFLGPKAAGKSSLIAFLRSGQPFEIDKSGAIRSPDPTLVAAIVDKRVSVQQSKWLHIKQDLPGDEQLRATWKQSIEDFRPSGIAYLIDGRDEAKLSAQVREACIEVLDRCYPDGARELRTFHVFINFSDVWATSPQVARDRVRVVRNALDDEISGRPSFSALRTDVASIHLSPNTKEWDAARRALERFGTDLSS